MSSTKKAKSLSFNKVKKTGRVKSLPSNLKRSRKNINVDLWHCRIVRANIANIIFDQIDNHLENLIKTHSLYCKNKNVNLVRYISKGFFGIVFEVEIIPSF